jgi:pyruvate kinase
MNFSVIVTIGPSILEEEKLKKINALGSCIYRINGAHADALQTRQIAETIRSFIPNATIMLDLPGNKVRTNKLSEPIRLVKGDTFHLTDYQVNYSDFRKHLNPGDLIYANDAIYTLEVIEILDGSIKIKSHSDGLLMSNKGLHVQGIHQEIPFLFQRDIELIEVACEIDLNIVSLSFVRTAEDVRVAKEILEKKNQKDITIFAKIETAAAIENLGYIFEEVDNVNVDRGDLSTDIGILKLPSVQKKIVDSALREGINIYLATQFLKNMETNPVPLIAELTSLYESIKSGISGIQLSEETAIGKNPVECVKLIFNMYHNSF